MRMTRDKSAATDTPRSEADQALRAALAGTLGIAPARAAAFDETTALFGALPELDSMAVATLLTDLEDRTGIIIDDDDIDAETFETFGALRAYLERKIAARRA